MKDFQEVLPYFRVARQGQDSAQAYCPVHAGGNEKNPSLTISRGREGRSLVFCHVCGKEKTPEILNAVGLQMTDILPERKRHGKTVRQFAEWPGKEGEFEGARFVQSYDYSNPNGYAFTKCRVSLPDGDKTFRYCRTDEEGYVSEFKVKDRQRYRALYPYKSLQAARDGSGMILYVEGEKDALNAIQDGFQAITAGGSNDWTRSLANYFEGLQVVVVPDNDKSGYESAVRVVGDLDGRGVAVKVIQWPDDFREKREKGDYSDFIEGFPDRREGVKAFQGLIDSAASPEQFRSMQEKLNRQPDSSAPADEPGKRKTNYYANFYEYNRDGLPNKVIEPKVTEWICKNYTFFVMGDLPYFINDTGCYVVDDGGAEMKCIIQSCIVPRLCTSAAVTSVFRMIIYQKEKRKKYEELNQYPVEWVPFLNGFFVPDENKVVPIRPEDFVINQIPHEFQPDAETACPVFDALLEFQLPDADEREQWLEYAGSCFNRDTSGQKWMIIRGGGGTGKSTQLNILIDCVGADNVSNETLQGLNERFNATALFGKMVNICADISSEDMKRIDVLKKITGEDKNGVKHERKGKDSFFFTPFCKLLFSANEIPLNRDEKSNAFYRRLMVTVMDRKPEHVDRNLHKKLQGELDAIIHRYMDALKRFYERGGYYVESERSKREVEDLRRSADSVIAFFSDEIVRDANCRISRNELYDTYKAYCMREDRMYPVSRNTLYKRFRDEGIDGDGQDSNGVRYFVGIGFKKRRPPAPSDDEETPFT